MRVGGPIASDISNTANQIVGGDGIVSMKDAQSYLNENRITEAMEKSNKNLQMDKTRLKFSIHDETKQIMVKIIDNRTNQVVKEIPPEKIVDLVASMIERLGLIVDEKV